MFPPKGANRCYYSNSNLDLDLDLDSLFEQGRIEFNQNKRKEIYLKAQEISANERQVFDKITFFLKKKKIKYTAI